MQNKQLESKKKKLLDLLYSRKNRSLSLWKLEKSESQKDYLLGLHDAFDSIILFLVDEPCMQGPL